MCEGSIDFNNKLILKSSSPITTMEQIDPPTHQDPPGDMGSSIVYTRHNHNKNNKKKDTARNDDDDGQNNGKNKSKKTYSINKIQLSSLISIVGNIKNKCWSSSIILANTCKKINKMKKCPISMLPMYHYNHEEDAPKSPSKKKNLPSSPRNSKPLFMLCALALALLTSVAFNLSWYTGMEFINMTSGSRWRNRNSFIHDAPVIVEANTLQKTQNYGDKKKFMDEFVTSKFQSGDNVEIIEHDPVIAGKITLWPGVISTINNDGTSYNIVKVEKSELVPNLTPKQFQPYKPYAQGSWAAYFNDESGKYVPVTIVGYKQSPPTPSRLNGNEEEGGRGTNDQMARGTYSFTFDNDKENVIHEGLAIKMHRFILP